MEGYDGGINARVGHSVAGNYARGIRNRKSRGERVGVDFDLVLVAVECERVGVIPLNFGYVEFRRLDFEVNRVRLRRENNVFVVRFDCYGYAVQSRRSEERRVGKECRL